MRWLSQNPKTLIVESGGLLTHSMRAAVLFHMYSSMLSALQLL
jgi:hypothetical protein